MWFCAVQRVGSGSSTRNQTCAPCSGSTEPEPWNHLKSSKINRFKVYYSVVLSTSMCDTTITITHFQNFVILQARSSVPITLTVPIPGTFCTHCTNSPSPSPWQPPFYFLFLQTILGSSSKQNHIVFALKYNSKRYTHSYAHSSTILNSQDMPECPLTDKRIQTTWCVHSVEYYSA